MSRDDKDLRKLLGKFKRPVTPSQLERWQAAAQKEWGEPAVKKIILVKTSWWQLLAAGIVGFIVSATLFHFPLSSKIATKENDVESATIEYLVVNR